MRSSTRLSDCVEIDNLEDTITICGVSYSGDLFRTFSMKAVEGELLSLGTRDDGVLDVYLHKTLGRMQ